MPKLKKFDDPEFAKELLKKVTSDAFKADTAVYLANSGGSFRDIELLDKGDIPKFFWEELVSKIKPKR